MNIFLKKNKKLGIVLGIYFIICIAILYFLNNLPDTVVNYIIHKSIAKNQAWKKHVFKEDALYVITTGTGEPMPDINRSEAQTIVVAGNQVLVFDVGPGSTHKLEISPINIGTTSALFMTHYHSDHIGGLGEFMLKRWANGSSQKPLPIFGPEGLEEVVNGFEAAYQLDKGYRIAVHGEKMLPLKGFGAESHSFDLGTDLKSKKTIYTKNGVEVIAFNVNHLPVYPAVGYRVHYKGRSVVITGDTKYTESLIEHSQNADLLISEALNKKFASMLADAAKNTNTNISKIANDIEKYHISPQEVAQIANKANIQQVVITHILPPVPTKLLERPFLKEARQFFKGNIYMAHDGTLITLHLNSRKITIKELLN